MAGPEPDEAQPSIAVAKLSKARRKHSLQAKYAGKLEGLDYRGRTNMAERMLGAWGIKDKSGEALQTVITLLKSEGMEKASGKQRKELTNATMQQIARKIAGQKKLEGLRTRARSGSVGKRSLAAGGTEPTREAHIAELDTSNTVPRSRPAALENKSRASSPGYTTAESAIRDPIRTKVLPGTPEDTTASDSALLDLTKQPVTSASDRAGYGSEARMDNQRQIHQLFPLVLPCAWHAGKNDQEAKHRGLLGC